MTTKGLIFNTKKETHFQGWFLMVLFVFVFGNSFAQKGTTTAKMDYSLTPTYGEVTLSTLGSTAHEVSITSGGSVNANYQGGDCSGWVSEAPDYRLQWNGSINNLGVLFIPSDNSEDATLLINNPAGDWFCNDDIESGNLNPGLVLTSPETGQYDIWVGSYEDGKYIEGTLFIMNADQLSNSKKGSTVKTLDYSLEPHFSSFSLTAGFEPDPYNISGTSGGEIDVSAMGIGSDCTGYAAEAPDYRLNWSGSTSDLKIFFKASTGGEDAVLIVNTPDGSWICNDDAHSSTLNPMVLLGGKTEGQFDIWIASLSSGDYIEGELTVTELDIRP